MSITSSQAERDVAVARCGDETDDQLRNDLAFWAVKVAEHEKRYQQLTNEREDVTDLYREAQAWVRLVTEELALRQQRAQDARRLS